MKMKNKWFVGLGVLLVCGFVLAGCDTATGGGGGGDGGGTPPADTSPVQTLASGDVAIKITTTNAQPKAAIAAKTGNYYWVYKGGVLINQGTVTVNGNAITFNSSSGGGQFKLTLSGGKYTFTSGSIPNTNGSPISGLTFNDLNGAKTIKITGFNLQGVTVIGGLCIFSESTGAEVHPPVAVADDSAGVIVIDGQTLTFTVVNWEDHRNNPTPWTRTGKFFIQFECQPPKNDPAKNGAHYYYSTDSTNPALFDIQDAVTTLEWSKFIWYADYTAG